MKTKPIASQVIKDFRIKQHIIGNPLATIPNICISNSHIPDKSHLMLLKQWGPCQLLSEVHAFLGTVGVLWMFVKNFAH